MSDGQPLGELGGMRTRLDGRRLIQKAVPVAELENWKSEMTANNSTLQKDLDHYRLQLNEASTELEQSRRAHLIGVEDIERKCRNELEDERNQHRRQQEDARRDAEGALQRSVKASRQEVIDLEQRSRAEIEREKNKRLVEVQEMNAKWTAQRQQAEDEAGSRDQEMHRVREDLKRTTMDLEQTNALNAALRERLHDASLTAADLEATTQRMKTKIDFLESDNQSQSQAFADLHRLMEEAIAKADEAHTKLRAEESLRRKLHNQVQELKGNIRVFCRVRPTLAAEVDESVNIVYPDGGGDSKEVAIMSEQKSAMGTVTTSKNGFAFDRVFEPRVQNAEIFDEISQLVQSALDGYNVCIFCYGQTGSGKTHTMSSKDGMIPLAVRQIYETAKNLEDKGWKYTMEGSFVEVYNEVLNDLLGKAEELDKKKHEIRHDGRGKTTVTDMTSVRLDSPSTVHSLMKRAGANRNVAATNANERSSRGHSVFILRLAGENSITGEKSEGMLNLVDLAGSERLAHSGATGDRLRETQNINKSLSCLGDVISALGQGKQGAHVPYRNSKVSASFKKKGLQAWRTMTDTSSLQLTYLLQNSLGGNSKTLMFVMISPLQAHMSESLTSLKFATKVADLHRPS